MLFCFHNKQHKSQELRPSGPEDHLLISRGGEPVAEKAKRGYYWLFILPFIGTLIPSFYAKITPTLFGLPYFYWYLILWIIITGIIGGIVYFLSEPRG